MALESSNMKWSLIRHSNVYKRPVVRRYSASCTHQSDVLKEVCFSTLKIYGFLSTQEFRINIHFSHIDLRKHQNQEEFLQVIVWELYNDQFWQQCEVESSWIFKKQFSLFTYWLQRAAKCKGVSSINHLRTLKRPNWQQCEVESSWIFKNNFRFSHIDNGQIDSNVKWSPEILWISAS